ncbi:hypothetical protein FEP96_05458 [Burkholderia multivorans]|nr:hypothetical protein [Burkholderia multivorans]
MRVPVGVQHLRLVHDRARDGNRRVVTGRDQTTDVREAPCIDLQVVARADHRRTAGLLIDVAFAVAFLVAAGRHATGVLLLLAVVLVYGNGRRQIIRDRARHVQLDVVARHDVARRVVQALRRRGRASGRTDAADDDVVAREQVAVRVVDLAGGDHEIVARVDRRVVLTVVERRRGRVVAARLTCVAACGVRHARCAADLARVVLLVAALVGQSAGRDCDVVAGVQQPFIDEIPAADRQVMPGRDHAGRRGRA